MATIHDRHYGWDNAIPPVVEIESGDSLEFDVIDAAGGQIGPNDTAMPVLDFGRVNPVNGPVFVKGARPGDVLEVEIQAIAPSAWGWTGIIPGFGLLADEFPDPWLQIWRIGGDVARGIRGVTIPVRPFPGTIGVALAEPGLHSIVPPRQNGGNMDIRHLVAGSRLLLPVWVEGALFSVGDTHAAQGDGEVCVTAIECAMTATLRFGLQQGHELPECQFQTAGPLSPRTNTAAYYCTTGHGPDLHEASRQAIRHMIAHLSDTYGFSRDEAYILCSVAVDLKISEIVDAPNWIVSACLPLSIFG